MSWRNPGTIQYNPSTDEYYYGRLIVADIATLIPVILKDTGNVEIEIMGTKGSSMSNEELLKIAEATVTALEEANCGLDDVITLIKVMALRIKELT